MRLTILYKPGCGDRPWLIRREGGAYEQHAHMHTKKDAGTVRRIVDAGKYPYCREYKTAIQRLLTEEEFKRLHKKQRYFNPKKGLSGNSRQASFFMRVKSKNGHFRKLHGK